MQINIINNLRKIFKHFIINQKNLSFKNILNLDIITKGESELDELQLFIHKKLLLFIEILKKLIFSDDSNTKIKVYNHNIFFN